MEVILKQDIAKIGKAGAIVKVRDGFARNFLFPNNLAMPSTSGNLKALEHEKQKKFLEIEKTKAGAEELKAKLAGISLTIPVLVHEEDKIYGSISANDIAAALKEEGCEIEKYTIALDEPIKVLGIYEIPIKLHPEVTAQLKVWIVKK